MAWTISHSATAFTAPPFSSSSVPRPSLPWPNRVMATTEGNRGASEEGMVRSTCGFPVQWMSGHTGGAARRRDESAIRQVKRGLSSSATYLRAESAISLDPLRTCRSELDSESNRNRKLRKSSRTEQCRSLTRFTHALADSSEVSEGLIIFAPATATATASASRSHGRRGAEC